MEVQESKTLVRLDEVDEVAGVDELGGGLGAAGEEDWIVDPRRRFWSSKLVSGTAGLGICVVLTYLVPGMQELQPWKVDEDYLPFWNIIGREFLGQGRKQAEAKKKLDRLEDELAAELGEMSDEVPGGQKNGALREGAAGEGLAKDGAKSDKPGIAKRPAVEPPPAKATIPPYAVDPEGPGDPKAAIQALEFPEKLGNFFLSLTKTDLGINGHITRVGHWGDSVLGNDGITAAVRTAMQARFGDAGHGFHAITQYDPSYRHKGIWFRERTPWSRCYVIQKRKCGADRKWGYGGNFGYTSGRALSEFRVAQKGAFGKSWSSAELWYEAHPRGGSIEIKSNDAAPQELSTRHEQAQSRHHKVKLSSQTKRLVLRSKGNGPVRIYGVAFEDEGPGVVWDGMALIGSFTSRMSKQDPAHLQAQIAHRRPDLIVLMFGGNDMLRERSDLKRTMKPYERDLSQLVQLMRGGEYRPDCLIVAPIDHGERVRGRIKSRAVVARMVKAQRRVAQAEGCAFFDTYEAMGGEGSIGRWFHRKPRLASGDLSHATSHGHKVLGRVLLYRAIMGAYRGYRDAMAGKAWPKPLRPKDQRPGQSPDLMQDSDDSDLELLDDADSP